MSRLAKKRRAFMAIITEIKRKIDELDAGSFQILCDAYLAKEGYPNIVSLGTNAGSQKTTRGTPDTYFCLPNGKYVFVEYTTTKSNLPDKIRRDIQKCLNTPIPTDQIEEIIYCHTSSNIEPKYDSEFKSICHQKGIKLAIIGIDQLSADLRYKYPSIIEDHLHISISTNQIQTIEDFTAQHDSNHLAAPLRTPFLLREKELETIRSAFSHVKTVVLTGPAGAGKTKLALEYAKDQISRSNARLLVIHNRALPLYEELTMWLEHPDNYFIVIDDANQLSNLHLIIEYVNKETLGYNVKILITVRDYAIESVKRQISQFTEYETISITTFSNEEIKTIVRDAFKITNVRYLDRISRISEGNARIAILAGRIALEANRLDSIDNVSQLYSEYYGNVLHDNGLDTDTSLLCSAAIIAFFNSLYLDRLDSILPLLENSGLSKDKFISALQKLHEMKLVDIYYDKAVQFSEQCLANFILKYAFYDKKIVSLTLLIETCFPRYKTKIVYFVDTLINVFRDEQLFDFVKSGILNIWESLRHKDYQEFFNFMKSFHAFNPTETLIELSEIINVSEACALPAKQIDIEIGKNYQNIDDEIINILGNYSNTPDIKTALDLFFQYYLKRPDKYIQFYHACVVYFGIQKDSSLYGYDTTIQLINKMIEYSDDWNNEYIRILFVDVVKHLLQLTFSPSESDHKNESITFYTIHLALEEGVSAYRTLIWKELIAIAQTGHSLSQIKQILRNYGYNCDESSSEVIKTDISYIIALIDLCFCKTCLFENIIVEHLQKILSRMNLQNDHIDAFLENPKMELYRIISRLDLESYHEYQETVHSRLQRYFKQTNSKAASLLDLATLQKEYAEIEQYESHDIRTAIFYALDLFNGSELIAVINQSLESDLLSFLPEKDVSQKLFFEKSANDVYELYSKIKSPAIRNVWLYAFFHEIPQNLIDKTVLSHLYDFLSDTSDSFIESSAYRDITFLTKYQIEDKDALIKGVDLIYDKRKYSPFITRIYFGLLFNHYHNSPEKVINQFSNNIKLLQDIYLWMDEYDQNNDYEGIFLLEICKKYPSFIETYVDSFSSRLNRNKNVRKLLVFFDLDNYINTFDQIFNRIMVNGSPVSLAYIGFFDGLFSNRMDRNRTEKLDVWIRHCILENACDKEKMIVLFGSIASCDTTHRIAYINLFLEQNHDFELFQSLPLFPKTLFWTNSAVPLYSAQKEFLNTILPALTGLNFIKHKSYIEKRIEALEKTILDEQLSDIINN